MGRRLSVCLLVCGVALVMFPSGARAGAQSPAPKPVARSASATPAPAGVKPSANDEILKLALAGMDESIILAKVTATDKSKYDTSADALLKLKSAGVSQRVIAAMFGITAPSVPVPVAVSSGPVGTPAIKSPSQNVQQIALSGNEPSTVSVDGVTEAGIYLQMPDGTLEQLEPAVYSGSASGNKYFHAVLGFIPENTQAVVRSLHANQRVQNSVPVFYFFFEKGNAGLSNTGGTFAGYMNSASSPNEFALVRMKESTDERQITVGKSSTIKDRVGVPSKDTIDISLKRIRPGLYEVRPKNPLTTGEYCFFYQGGSADKGGTGKLFDFGVDPGASIQ